MCGPQGDFCTAFGAVGKPVVHIIPCCASACSDLKNVLYDGDDLRKRKGPWFLVFAGSSFSARNLVLASLAPQYVVVGGGPGTWLEVSWIRRQRAGLIPLVHSGGLVEGI